MAGGLFYYLSMKYSAYLLFYLALMLLLTGAFTHFSSGGLSVATGYCLFLGTALSTYIVFRFWWLRRVA